jgi:hypothetical protein
VSTAQQSRAPAVVRHSRLLAAVAGAWLYLQPALVRADPAAPAHATQSSGYGFMLGAAYVLAPVLALAVGGGVSELTEDDDVAVLSGCTMFLLPAMVHVANGAGGRGAAAFGTMLGASAVGVFGGGLLGYAIGDASCDETTESDCYIPELRLMLLGSIVGGILGYGANAVFDTSGNSDLPGEAGGESRVSITPWVTPLAAPARSRDGTGPAFSGASLGATLVW